MAITGSPLDGPADCTLACDEGHLTAHKILLCAHSKYLLDILSNFPEAEHPIIILTEINIIDIRILVNYMYTGELTITNDCCPSNILRAAKILRIESLTDFEDDEDQQQITPSDQDDVDLDLDLDEDHYHQHHNHHHNHHQAADSNNNGHHHQVANSVVAATASKQHQQKQEQHHQQQQQQQQQHQHQKQQHQKQQQQQQPHPHPIRSGPNNKIRCHLCNIGLSDVKCLYRHVLTRHLSEKWGYKCEFCDREFSRDDHLMRHYTTKHKNMEFNREKIRETRRLNREMAKNYHDQISKFEGSL